MLEEKDLIDDILINKIDKVINDDKKLQTIKNNLKKFKVEDSAEIIYNKLRDLIK